MNIISLQDQMYEKLVRNLLDILINKTLNNGVLYYFITINTIWPTPFDNSSKCLLKWENYLKDLMETINKINSICYVYYCHELNENRIPHTHIILSINSVLGFNNLIKDNIFYYLINEGYGDIKVDQLSTFLDIKNTFNYIWKDLIKTEITHSFVLYNNLYLEEFTKLEDAITYQNWKIKTCYYIYDIIKYPSINKQSDFFNEYTIINLINFYLFYKKLYWCNNFIYEKKENTLISYKKKNTIKELIEDIDNIYNELLPVNFIQLKNLDIYTLKIKYLKNLDYYINNPLNTFINKIKISFELLEFKDGIYMISHNLFISKNKLKNLLQQIENQQTGTLKYYDSSYKYIKNKKPTFWLNQIKKTLKENESLEEFLSYFIAIFYKNINFLGKKRVLYIYGEPNTKKTTLTAQVLINFYGLENIGLISKNKNFLFESLIDKEIAIFDECEHYNIPIDVLLKILEGSDVIIDQKFKKPTILKALNIIMLSNNKITENKETNEFIKKAIDSRIKYVKFNDIETNLKNLQEINKELLKEEPFIILYCNNILHKTFKTNKKITKKNYTTLIEDKTK